MKRSVVITLVFLLIAIYPFKLAYLNPGGNEMAALFSFLVVALGFVAVITITSFGGNSREIH